MDTNQLQCLSQARAVDPCIFCKCLLQEIKSQPFKEDTFLNLMNQKGQLQLQHQKGVYSQHRYHQGYHSGVHGNWHGQQHRRKMRKMPERQNLSVVWQALLHCVNFAERRSTTLYSSVQKCWPHPTSTQQLNIRNK